MKYRYILSSLLAIFLVYLSLNIFLFAQESIESTRRELEKTQEQLRVVQDKIDALDKQELGVLNRIDAYEEKINLTKKYIRELNQAQQTKKNEIITVTNQITSTQGQIIARQSDLEKLLINYYKEERILPVELFLSNKSIADVYKKFIYLRIIAQDRKNLIKQFRGMKQDLESQQARLIAANLQLAQYKQKRQAEQSDLKTSQSMETKILDKVRTQKSQSLTLEDELKTAAAKLENLIAQLEQQRRVRKLAPGTHYLEIMKGKLPWPYYGTVIARFGTKQDPKYKTKIRNTGIDIQTPKGADIKAIAKGRVVYADRFMGYGNMVILDHGDGYYSLYSNLSDMSATVGEDVEQSEVVGSSTDILHFELRSEGKPVDPLLWLN
jgi:septal ring factor EnvC (AmiA/AmiB activator)